MVQSKERAMKQTRINELYSFDPSCVASSKRTFFRCYQVCNLHSVSCTTILFPSDLILKFTLIDSHTRSYTSSFGLGASSFTTPSQLLVHFCWNQRQALKEVILEVALGNVEQESLNRYAGIHVCICGLPKRKNSSKPLESHVSQPHAKLEYPPESG